MFENKVSISWAQLTNIGSTVLNTIKKTIVIKKVLTFHRINSLKMMNHMKKQIMSPKVTQTIQTKKSANITRNTASKVKPRVRTNPARRPHRTSSRCQARFKEMKPITYRKVIAMKKAFLIFRISKEAVKMTLSKYPSVRVRSRRSLRTKMALCSWRSRLSCRNLLKSKWNVVHLRWKNMTIVREIPSTTTCSRTNTKPESLMLRVKKTY